MCMGVVTTIDIRDAPNYGKTISYFLYVVLIAVATEIKCTTVTSLMACKLEMSLSKCDGAILYVGMWHAIVRHMQE